MKKRMKLAIKNLVLFLIFSSLMLGIHYVLGIYYQIQISYKIHFLIWLLTCIVVLSILITSILGHKDKVGFVYLGFVLFKMFGIGYLAYFEPEFKANVILYFIIFWVYLSVEAVLVIKSLQKHDKNHIKHIE